MVVSEAAEESGVSQAFAREKLKEGLRREYDSFFQPMEEDLYRPDVTFEDPLITLSGVDAYRNNVNMLAGNSLLGKLCFTDCGLQMHSVRDTDDGGLETRWTLQFRFKLLPWAPVARFTGVSKYTLDANSKVVRQRDYWDSVNLNGGEYEAAPKSAAFLDLLSQLAPQKDGAKAASEKELPYVLLRRAEKSASGAPAYEIRRYPQHVSVMTEYFRRIDAFGTLGAYTGGANDADADLQPYVPSLMSVRQDARTLKQVEDDSLDLKPSEEAKQMRWPMAVPALKEPPPPQPAGQIALVSSLDLVPTRVVAVLAFSDPTTEPVVRGYHALLSKRLRDDGLKMSEGVAEEQFRLAQFDALNSFGARRSEVWIDLEDHPWE